MVGSRFVDTPLTAPPSHNRFHPVVSAARTIFHLNNSSTAASNQSDSSRLRVIAFVVRVTAFGTFSFDLLRL
jgi:hypothetical protein